jgi:hypothetical protein
LREGNFISAPEDDRLFPPSRHSPSENSNQNSQPRRDGDKPKDDGDVPLAHAVQQKESAPVGHPKLSLIKALARAHGWYENVVQGQALDMRSLARQAGLTERYVGKVFGCTFLAPDIIASILEGRQPHDLNFEKLCEHVPLSWAEQREHFGFPPASSQRSKSLLQ